MAKSTDPLLTIRKLSVTFDGFRAADSVNLTIEPGEVVGIVGESGSGKSVMMMALMGLIKEPGQVTSEKLHFDGKNLKTLSSMSKQQIMGKDIAMIFQDPISTLNPCFTVGFQIMEVLRTHLKLGGQALKKEALRLMEQVEIPDAQSRLKAYPHQLSGGMCQRIAIAMAIACRPKLLIADEPTTALDVTIQSQIIDLLLVLQKTHGMALIMITHDLALIAQIAHRIEMMYAGQIVEQGTLPYLFASPAHPYTSALLASLPEYSQKGKRLTTLSGTVPSYYDRPEGCLFAPRCAYAQNRCSQQAPTLEKHASGMVRCYFPLSAKTATRKKAAS